MVADYVAEQVVAAVVSLLPAQVAIRSHEGAIMVEDMQDLSWATIDLKRIIMEKDEDLEGIATACVAALGHVQDFTMRSLTTPWPESTDASTQFPLPYAEPLSSTVIDFGFESPLARRNIGFVRLSTTM